MTSVNGERGLEADEVIVLVARGNALRELHRPAEALLSYDRALALAPDDVEALNQRGNALRALRRPAEAVASYDRVLALQSDHLAALYNRGNVLLELRQPEDALASLDRVLALKPDDAEAHTVRGNALLDLKRPEDALASYDRALALQPGCIAAHYSRGNVMLELRRPAEALASYDRALALAPDLVEALSNRGDALLLLKQPEEALASYEQALAIAPDFVGALGHRGNALLELQRHEEALASYDRVLVIEPNNVAALNNCGNILLQLKRPEDALANYDRAIAIEPDSAGAWTNRGNALLERRRHDEALISYERALALDPHFAGALNNRGNLLREAKRYDDAARTFAQLIALAPDADHALGNLLDCQLRCCEWRKATDLTARIAAAVERGEKAVAPLLFLTTSRSAAAQLQCTRAYISGKHPASPNPLWTGQRYRHDRIRLAYLSADYREHAVAYLAAGLFELHDRERFETIAISFGPDAKDDMRKRLERSFERFIDVRRTSDREAAHMLCEMEVDIAIDLTGITTDCRPGILAHRPAPIQVNYLGYAGTMGADYIDYILADRNVIPSGHEAFYAEKVVRLPDSFLVTDAKRAIAERTPSRAEFGLPESGFVFCCFNNSYKLSPDIFDVWMRLLGQVPNSVLWLMEDGDVVSTNLRREAWQRGIAPKRLVFSPRVTLNSEHLARQKLADLFLDTLPYNAHATASDALWAGLPVLTCMGSTFAGRVAGSLLIAAGLPELVTHSLDEYEALALRLATSPGLLSGIRTKLAHARSSCPLFDTNRFRAHVEAAYTAMWERYQRGEPPASFDVGAIGGWVPMAANVGRDGADSTNRAGAGNPCQAPGAA